MESLVLDGISEEMGRAILYETPSAALKTVSLALDWVSIDMLTGAERYFARTTSIDELSLSGSLIPKLTWTRPSVSRICCSAIISFASVDWDVLFAWIQSESALPKEIQWSVQSMDKDDLLNLGNLLSECQFLRQLNVFWSSRFTLACAKTFLTSISQNNFVVDIVIDDGNNATEIPNPTVRWLQKECKKIAIRNQVRSLIRSQSPTSLWPFAFAKSNDHASFIFHAMQQGMLPVTSVFGQRK
jgi:hypothetical protein